MMRVAVYDGPWEVGNLPKLHQFTTLAGVSLGASWTCLEGRDLSARFEEVEARFSGEEPHGRPARGG